MPILRRIKRKKLPNGGVVYTCIWPHRQHHYHADYEEIRDLASRLIQLIREEQIAKSKTTASS